MSQDQSGTAAPIPTSTDLRTGEVIYQQCGLTKREYFAGLAMQGLIASCSTRDSFEMLARERDRVGLPEGNADLIIAKCAVNYADALLKELAK